ncbi:MAG: hypothetical protein JSS07_00120 [Proteobacteria bacterium]|nr:hypothetical protein [Pseudomonadota bacterium]
MRCFAIFNHPYANNAPYLIRQSYLLNQMVPVFVSLNDAKHNAKDAEKSVVVEIEIPDRDIEKKQFYIRNQEIGKAQLIKAYIENSEIDLTTIRINLDNPKHYFVVGYFNANSLQEPSTIKKALLDQRNLVLHNTLELAQKYNSHVSTKTIVEIKCRLDTSLNNQENIVIASTELDTFKLLKVYLNDGKVKELNDNHNIDAKNEAKALQQARKIAADDAARILATKQGIPLSVILGIAFIGMFLISFPLASTGALGVTALLKAGIFQTTPPAVYLISTIMGLAGVLLIQTINLISSTIGHYRKSQGLRYSEEKQQCNQLLKLLRDLNSGTETGYDFVEELKQMEKKLSKCKFDAKGNLIKNEQVKGCDRLLFKKFEVKALQQLASVKEKAYETTKQELRAKAIKYCAG